MQLDSWLDFHKKFSRVRIIKSGYSLLFLEGIVIQLSISTDLFTQVKLRNLMLEVQAQILDLLTGLLSQQKIPLKLLLSLYRS